MKNILACSFCLVFFAGLPAWAQSAAQLPAQEDIFNYPLRPETTQAFNTVSAQLAEHPITKGKFSQEKILSRLGRSIKSEGNFIITAQQGMVWETLSPFPSTLILAKDYLIQSRPGGQRTVLSAEGNETFLRFAEVLSAVFSGNAQGLVNNFEVFFRNLNSPAGRTWELGLSPLDMAIGSFAAKITMSGDNVIRSITIYEQSGDITKYTLLNHSHPVELNVHERALFTIP